VVVDWGSLHFHIRRDEAGQVPARAQSDERETDMATTQEDTTKDIQGLNLTSAGPSLTVNDIEKSLAWYRDVLGCTVGDKWEHEGKMSGVEMKAGRVSFWLAQDDWKKGRNRVKGEGFRLYCETDQSVDRVAERIKANGGKLDQEPKDEPWGGRLFTLADPDGFKITIMKVG
jgi:lactoylglutathione lyase